MTGSASYACRQLELRIGTQRAGLLREILSRVCCEARCAHIRAGKQAKYQSRRRPRAGVRDEVDRRAASSLARVNHTLGRVRSQKICRKATAVGQSLQAERRIRAQRVGSQSDHSPTSDGSGWWNEYPRISTAFCPLTRLPPLVSSRSKDGGSRPSERAARM